MVKYIKCPRCDLNYIDSEKQEYCDVCIAEIKGNRLQFADLDDEELEEIDAEFETEELCPVCGTNHLRSGEKVCESCRQLQEYEDDDDVDIEKDEEWKNYLDEDDSDLTLGEELEEELKAELAEDEEDEMYDGDDFYESEDVDSLDELEDDEFDEDEDDYDDDDDDDF